MRAIHLQTDYLTEPLGLGNPKPRFYWNCECGVKQTAYQIVCTRCEETVWDSGKVESSAMTHIRYEGMPLHSRDIVYWTVTLWDENGVSGEASESCFELGLLEQSDWTAKWISGNYRPEKNHRYPADCFKKEFTIKGKVAKARLYSTARGVYDVTVNDTRIEDFILAPGVTDYRKRIQVQTYDVTDLLREQNTVELRLADGWYRGSVAAYGATNVYGMQTSVLAQLEITYKSGFRETVVTDNSWAWSNDGPIRFADLKDGEVYNASMHPRYAGKALEVTAPKAALLPSDNVPVTEHERFSPKLLVAKNGARILDFGQNIAGYLEFSVKGHGGQKLKLVFGEVLDANGLVDLSGIQETRPATGWTQLGLIKKLLTGKVTGDALLTPMQEIVFFCSGKEDRYKSSFCVFGFRYVQIESNVEIDPGAFTAIAVYSDMEQSGVFSCSDERVNKLLENTRWSMKGNFLDVPTDCPTRERLGWTGDAQIFFDTGAYLMNTAPFFAKWLRDMADSQYKEGFIPSVLPYNGVEMMYKGSGASVGWADAVYLIPYRFSKRFGDTEVLRQYWPMMKKYTDFVLAHLGQADKKAAKTNPENAYTYEKGVHLGEWLEPEEFQDEVPPSSRPKRPEEATAYLHLTMVTMTEIAKLLGENEYAARLQDVAEGSKRAYLRFAELDTDRQAKLVRPLALGLLDGEVKVSAQQRLKRAVENFGYKVGTGFLSTPFLLPVLTEAGEAETAYKMLTNVERPGWLYEIEQGATTIWESWEGNVSRNHYSPGAVCQWLFDTVAGIRVDGENHFVIAPIPGGTLKYAEASYKSLYGIVKSRWERSGSSVKFEFEIPANCTAEIRLPYGRTESVTAGRYEYEI